MTEVKFPARIMSFDDLDINQKFLLAAFRGITPVVKNTLALPPSKSKEFDPNCYDSKGFTALHGAAGLGFKDMVVELLKDKRINPHALDKFSRHPIELAWQGGDKEIVKILYETLPGKKSEGLSSDAFVKMLFSSKEDIMGECFDISELRELKVKTNRKLDVMAYEFFREK